MDEKGTVKGKLRFEIQEGGVWQACGPDGAVAYRAVDGDVLDVDLAEDGLPADEHLRGAVEAGIAAIE